MDPIFALKFKIDRTKQDEKREAEERKRAMKTNQLQSVEIFFWYKDDTIPKHFVPCAISDYPFLNLAQTRTHYDNDIISKPLLQRLGLGPGDDIDRWSHNTNSWCTDITTCAIEIDKKRRPILLKKPEVTTPLNLERYIERHDNLKRDKKVLKRTWEEGLQEKQSIEEGVMKRICSPKPKTRQRALTAPTHTQSLSFITKHFEPILYSPTPLPTPSPPPYDWYQTEAHAADMRQYLKETLLYVKSPQPVTLESPQPVMLKSPQLVTPKFPQSATPKPDTRGEDGTMRAQLKEEHRVCVSGVVASGRPWPHGMIVKDMIDSFTLVDSHYWKSRYPHNQQDRINEVFQGVSVDKRQFHKQRRAWQGMTRDEWAYAQSGGHEQEWVQWRKTSKGWKEENERNHRRIAIT
ncbi:hypothetical protein C8R41DRAFT_900652 [Lentinula lateritia]|uniref:Uncharacterized protein n=1 Tax=Lentinula lateritia TaxID=40482 RepID=A0ABQ8VS52_9AGAR|nr:hypothetical protein C8R41DRAFT_900652 [Lentinula lateritia]